MRTSIILTSLMAGVVMIVASSTAQAANPVVVLDVAKVFKEHVRFKKEMEMMTAEAKTFQESLKQQEAQLRQLAEQLNLKKVGTPEYSQIEEQLTRIRSDGQVRVQMKKKELMVREAKIYYKYYTELQGYVTQFATQHGISLVLRWNSSEIDPDNRVSVQQGIARGVVYQRSLDITGLMITKVNEGVPNPSTARAPGATIPGRTAPR